MAIDPALRAAFGTVLHELAEGLRAFGRLVREESAPRPAMPADTEPVRSSLEELHEARARLADLLLAVDPRRDPAAAELVGGARAGGRAAPARAGPRRAGPAAPDGRSPPPPRAAPGGDRQKTLSSTATAGRDQSRQESSLAAADVAADDVALPDGHEDVLAGRAVEVRLQQVRARFDREPDLAPGPQRGRPARRRAAGSGAAGRPRRTGAGRSRSACDLRAGSRRGRVGPGQAVVVMVGAECPWGPGSSPS